MKIMLGIPSGRGILCHDTVKSVMSLALFLQTKGHEIQFNTIGHAEVAVARNILATLFYESDSEVFIGIDDDVSIEVQLAVKLLRYGANFIGTYVPLRSINLEAFAEGVKAGLPTEEARVKATGLIGPGGDQFETGIHELEQIGLGFYILRKPLLKAMIDKKVAATYTTKLPGFQRKTYGFFSNLILDDGAYLSEDYSFCRRVRHAGYRVMAYKGPGIGHVGQMKFQS